MVAVFFDVPLGNSQLWRGPLLLLPKHAHFLNGAPACGFLGMDGRIIQAEGQGPG
jgi:hypothetical protein